MPRAEAKRTKSSLRDATRAQLVRVTERALAFLFAYDAYINDTITLSKAFDRTLVRRYMQTRQSLRNAVRAAYGKGKKTKGAA